MKHIDIIPSEFKVPAIVTGCMRIAQMPLSDVQELVETSIACGANMFDHADIYGGGESEAQFGKLFGQKPSLRDSMLLQTKCGIGKGMYDASKEHILAAVDGSLSRLGTDCVDVLLLHRPDALIEPEEVAEAFAALHAQGKVKHFGVSNQNAAQMQLLGEALPMPIYFNQLQLSLMHSGMVDAGINVNTRFDGAVDRDGEALDYCRLNHITIQAWSPFQHGFFGGVFLDDPQCPELNAELARLAEKYGVTKSAVAAAWILRHPAKMQVVTGTTRPRRVEEISRGADFSLTREEWYALYKAAGNKLP